MPTIVVDVMPKAEILDPQGKAVARALARTGHPAITSVRIGKRIELSVVGPIDDAVIAEVRRVAEELLSNSVIENVVSIRYSRSDARPADASTPSATPLRTQVAAVTSESGA